MSLLQADGSVLDGARRLDPGPPPVVCLALGDCDRLIRPLAEIERRVVESAIILCAGNLALCAMRLGISRTGLRSKLNAYRIADGETQLPDRRALPRTMAARAGVI